MIKPLRNNIVVKREEVETTSSLGIILPASAQETSSEGVVVACGEGLWANGERVPLDVKVGDRVLFNAFTGKEIVCEGKTYTVMLDADVYAINN